MFSGTGLWIEIAEATEITETEGTEGTEASFNSETQRHGGIFQSPPNYAGLLQIDLRVSEPLS
jgi:hypothetical protein